jgi:TonB family protein
MRFLIAAATCALAAATTARSQDPLPDDAGQTTEPDPIGQVLQAGVADPPGLEPQAARIIDAYVTLAVTPRYPKAAQRDGLDGEVTLAFDIAKHGRAENIEVVAEEPPGVFDKEAADAMKYWAFSPARLSSCGTSVQRGRVTMRFVHDPEPHTQLSPLVVNEIPQPPRPMEETTLAEFRQQQAAAASSTGAYDPRNNVPTRRVQPEFPTRALERRKEGMVALSFMIEPDGSVSDVEVVDTVAGYLFQRPSLSAIKQWEFEPRIRNGQRVRAPGCHEFVFHVDEYKRSGRLAREREEGNIRTFSPN